MPSRSRTHPVAIRDYPPFYGRALRCEREGCITLLNGYNPGPRCLVHSAKEGDGLSDAQRSAKLDREAKREAKLAARS